MADFGKLISGYRVFKATTFQEQKEVIKHTLRQGVKPTTLFITSSELRISPDNIFSCNPGELYVCRNIGALIPEYSNEKAGGIIAAIEYGVKVLNVENIVVLGHSNCDAIKQLMSDDDSAIQGTTAIKDWLSIASEARDSVKKALKNKTPEEQLHACEQESILVSLKNLLTYPFIVERIENGDIDIYGWHFDIETGTLMAFDPETKFFDPIG